MEEGEQIHIGKWNLLGAAWDIYLLNPKSDGLAKEHVWGRTTNLNQEVFINAKLKPDTRDETLLHEFLHIISCRLELDLKEDLITQLATTLHIILVEADLWKPIQWPDKKEKS